MVVAGVEVPRHLVSDLGELLAENGSRMTATILTRANRAVAASVHLSRLDRENVLAVLAKGAPDGLEELHTKLLAAR
jgi:hypothetical protein